MNFTTTAAPSVPVPDPTQAPPADVGMDVDVATSTPGTNPASTEGSTDTMVDPTNASSSSSPSSVPVVVVSMANKDDPTTEGSFLFQSIGPFARHRTPESYYFYKDHYYDIPLEEEKADFLRFTQMEQDRIAKNLQQQQQQQQQQPELKRNSSKQEETKEKTVEEEEVHSVASKNSTCSRSRSSGSSSSYDSDDYDLEESLRTATATSTAPCKLQSKRQWHFINMDGYAIIVATLQRTLDDDSTNQEEEIDIEYIKFPRELEERLNSISFSSSVVVPTTDTTADTMTPTNATNERVLQKLVTILKNRNKNYKTLVTKKFIQLKKNEKHPKQQQQQKEQQPEDKKGTEDKVEDKENEEEKENEDEDEGLKIQISATDDVTNTKSKDNVTSVEEKEDTETKDEPTQPKEDEETTAKHVPKEPVSPPADLGLESKNKENIPSTTPTTTNTRFYTSRFFSTKKKTPKPTNTTVTTTTTHSKSLTKKKSLFRSRTNQDESVKTTAETPSPPPITESPNVLTAICKYNNTLTDKEEFETILLPLEKTQEEETEEPGTTANAHTPQIPVEI